MINGAKVVVSASWNGQSGRVTGVDYQRLPVARLLRGRKVEDALSLVPSLYSVCARVQLAVARAALQSARSGQVTRGEDPLMRVCLAAESIRELLWRILLDWPTLHGLDARREDYVVWHRAIQALLCDTDHPGDAVCGAARLLRFKLESAKKLGQQLLSCRLGDLLTQANGEVAGSLSLGDLLLADGVLPLNPLGGLKVDSHDVNQRERPTRLPKVDATQLLAGLGGVPDEQFCKAPVWQGRAAETGAWARQCDHASVQALFLNGHSVSARLLAQLVDLAEWASVLLRPEVGTFGDCSAAFADGVGLASCDTARGTLIHVARLDAGSIVDYAVIAPTDWNFSKHGVVWHEGRFVASGEPDARRALTALVLAFNPCVPFEIRLERQEDA